LSLHLESLNPEQRAAVTLPEGHALILAGAGSGKTRVLTTRIAWLLQTGAVTPAGVLAVTFTNKAAREMLTRLSAMIALNPRGMWIGTFHGLCNRMLRAHHQEAGLPRAFQILDSQDQLAAVKRLLRSLNVDEDRFAPRDVQYFIMGRKEEGLRASEVPAPDDTTRRYAELYAEYDAQCARESVVDFAELLLRSHELLARNEPLREHYRARFRHLLVDEFQDTNKLQYRWLKLLAGEGASLFAVGDDDQSIYAFRGANVGNMAEFERDYRGTRRAPRAELPLARQHPRGGERADRAQHEAPGQEPVDRGGRGEPLRVFEAQSDADEARWMVEEIQALKREDVPLSDVALLYRSNAQSRVLEHALFTAGAAVSRVRWACASSSARKSSTRSPICASSPRRPTTTRSCAW
jgi:DNA helicase II / ATP-dependent DNA helicase PcrA